MTEPIRYELTKLVHLAQMALSARMVHQPPPVITCICFFVNETNDTMKLQIDGGSWRANGALILSGTFVTSQLGVILEFNEYGILTRWRTKISGLQSLLLDHKNLTAMPIPARIKRLKAQSEEERSLTTEQVALKSELRALVKKRGLTAGQIAARSGGRLPRSSAYAFIIGKRFPRKEESLRLFLQGCKESNADTLVWLKRWADALTE